MESKKNARWVIGHKIIPIEVSGNYDMVIGETPAQVSGPPPHYHNGFNEVFLVIEGEMEFIVSGKPRTVKAGDSVDLPPHKIHTFRNKSDSSCKWVNIHSPKGFLAFFEDFGISSGEKDAMAKSVDDSVIEKVMQEAAEYDMHIELQNE